MPTRRCVAEAGTACDGPRALLLESREVPLGGVRAMSVHRSLPQRDLPLVGAWCFLDRFGPQVTRMRVEPHPHIGLQTVTWPFAGDIRHRDSVGSDVVLSRGALNLMTSGEGIAHSEYSVGEEAVPLDALQLWVALPESRRHGAPAFERHEQLPSVELPALSGAPATATVVLGELAGVSSPASDLHADRRCRDPAAGGGSRRDPAATGVGVRDRRRRGRRDRDDRHPVDAMRPSTSTGSTCCTSARDAITVRDRRGGDGALVFLLGGAPFEDEIVMWWNFVGRSHEEIVDAREAWEAGAARFGHVVDHGDERVPAPPLPAVRLTRRRRRV